MPKIDVTGVARELFFVQSCIDAGLNVFYSHIGDFQIQDAVFEIDGKSKTRRQLRSAADGSKAILVKDDILVSGKNVIPLYYFGFLY